MLASILTLKIFICHYNSSKWLDMLLGGLLTHSTNKIGAIREIFKKYPNRLSQMIETFCIQNKSFFELSKLLALWCKNRTQLDYASHRDKTLNQIHYENWLLSREIYKQFDNNETKSYFSGILQWKFSQNLTEDINKDQNFINNLPYSIKNISLDNLRPTEDFSKDDFVRKMVFTKANISM